MGSLSFMLGMYHIKLHKLSQDIAIAIVCNILSMITIVLTVALIESVTAYIIINNVDVNSTIVY